MNRRAFLKHVGLGAAAASGERAVTFTASLKAGKTRLQTWFYDQTGNELCGAYYARVYRK